MSGDLAGTVKAAHETPLFLKNVLHRDAETAKIVKVFGSLFTLSRGSADEVQRGISSYLRFSYQEEVAASLEAAVDQWRDSPASFEESAQALKPSWDIPAKAFLAIKLCEILRQVDPGWTRRLPLIGQSLGLPEPVFGFIKAVVDPTLAQSAGGLFVQFWVGPNGSENCFQTLELTSPVYITYWNKEFYISVGQEDALLDGKVIPANFAFRFDPLAELRVGGFRLLYRQLQMLQRWFQLGTKGVPSFSLSDQGRPVLQRPSDKAQTTCTLKPTALGLTQGGRELRLEWQDTHELNGVEIRVSEVAEIIMALAGAPDSSDQRATSACLLELVNVGCNFGKIRGLREISCLAAGGQMVAVMGPSGCGKSTLLGTMIGSVPLTAGIIKMNGVDLAGLVRDNPRLLGYVPQDNITFSTLTVAENLRYGARLRLAEPTKQKVDACVQNVLEEIDLKERAATIVGDEDVKTLSGGQRKRVSLGLELLTPKSILLLDEPTSGLSSGDSERILRILRARADNGALVLVVIHQPSAALFRLFDRLLLLDRGGMAAFYGDPLNARSYLEKVAPLPSVTDADLFDPASLLGALEAPARRIDGRAEERRMFDPDYWKTRFDWFRRKHSNPIPAPELRRPPADEPLHGWVLRQIQILFERSLKCKLRDSLGIGLSLGTAIFLGFVVGRILSAEPVLKDNNLFPSFPFLSSIVALFIGMSSSITEVIRERPIVRREKLLKVDLTLWLISKFATLILINLVPIILYTIISMWLLQVPESFWLYISYLLYLWLVSAVGVALGLAISSFPDIKTAAATSVLPLILVPQLVLAGADPFKFGSVHSLIIFPKKVAEIKGHIKKADVEDAKKSGTQLDANIAPEDWDTDHVKTVGPPPTELKQSVWNKEMQKIGTTYERKHIVGDSADGGKETVDEYFLVKPPEIAGIMPSRWSYEGLIALYNNHSHWRMAERLHSDSVAYSAAVTKAQAAKDDPSKAEHNLTDDQITTMRLIVSLIKSLQEDAESKTLKKYNSQLTNDLIFDNDPQLSTWDVAHPTALVRYKPLPFIGVVIPTEWYNALVLLLMTFIVLAISRILLSSWFQSVVMIAPGLLADRIAHIRGKAGSRAR
jgi:ABC-type multidrug transport system ATPase subunit